MGEMKEDKVTTWNLTREGGWLKYNKLCEEASEKIEEAVNDETKSIEEVMQKIDKIHNKIKYKAFGKVTVKAYKKGDKLEKRSYSEEEEAEALMAEQEKVVDKELKEIEVMRGGRCGRVWEIRKRVIGIKKI